ncbi:receptor-type tyrosine-protein phosphatase eta-like [Xyrauchen texanus]|uniref:receptor-type tyrosine-protein phosphatase eta-like n=1 Tax=Xyrauchen texanus TaxID=154827 RepID=UPI002241ECB2|nr:receptor-type tyrosine-protein phosphatase eta-like [Xyrauchen texanus]
MGQQYLLRASVFRASVFLALLVLIPHVQSDCTSCLYNSTSTYFLRLNCSILCCNNYTTSPAQVQNIFVLSSNNSLNVSWKAPLGLVDSYVVSISSAELNVIQNHTTFTKNVVIMNLTAGRVYNLTVTSICGILRNISNMVSVATNPSPPEALIVTGQTNVSISLFWSRPPSMGEVTVTYEVSYRPSQSGLNLTFSQSASLNHTLTSLLPGSQYDIAVVTIGVNDSRSSLVTLTAYTAPNAVQNLEVSPVSTSSVNLTWIPPNGTSSLLSYSVNINTSEETFNTTFSNYQITALDSGSQYNCSVRTLIRAANISGPSKSILCNTKPMPVSNLTASLVGTTEILLSWCRPSNYKAAYMYEYVSVNGTQWIQSRNETAKVPDLIPGNNYTFTVQTVANGLSSEPVSISVFTGLDKASSISAVGNTTSMRVEWRPPAGNVGLYSVKILLNGTVVKTENRTNETSVVFSDLLPGTSYSIIVTSISGPIKQDSDNVMNATLPTPPGNLSVTAQSTNSLNISWARPVNMGSLPLYYLLQYNNSTLISNSINCSQNYRILPSLSAGVQYNITVKTVGALGYLSSPKYIAACTNPTAVSDVIVNGSTENSIFLSWQQWDVQQYGYSYLLIFTHSNGTIEQKTANTTVAQLLSLQSARRYNISIITQAACGTKSSPHIMTATSKPFPVSKVCFDYLNVSTVRLNWVRPNEYHSGFSYRILVSNCTDNITYLSTSSENITVADLEPGTLCHFSVYSVAYGSLGEPVNISVLTKPSIVVPRLDNQGSNNSLLVTWDHPVGGLDMYILNISSAGWSNSTKLNITEHSHTFTHLKAATIFTVSLITVKGTFQETSSSVDMATYPNKPGEISELSKSTHSVLLEWEKAQDMTVGSFNYSLNCSLGSNKNQFLTPNNSYLLDSLRSGKSYNISVATVGPMGFQSGSVSKYPVTTKPDPVQNLHVVFTTTNVIHVEWVGVEGVPQYVVSVYSAMRELQRKKTSSYNCTVHDLMPSTQYNISVQSITSDSTEGAAVWLQNCTDADPVENLTCIGPNLTLPILNLSWSPPSGDYLGFEVELSSSDSSVNTSRFNYTFEHLKYNTPYTATLWTLGCGKKSTLKEIHCMTGITRPVVPKIETTVTLTEKHYNKFTFILQPEVFNDSNGPVLYYGVLVSSGIIDNLRESSTHYDQLKTYKDWKAKHCTTYLAVVKEGRRDMKEQTIVIGDQTTWNGYTNGELDAKGIYSFAVIAFTHLEISMENGLVDVSKSYYSISQFYQSSITLPENPVVIAGAAGGVGFAAVLIVIIIVGVVVFRRKQGKDNSTSVPIHTIRNKVSDPIKVEDYEAYYKRQRADSFCGFAEDFEDLRQVGINQSKAVALAPENKAKNRYNNVLPYDLSRVKLSVLGSPFDDYVNASYMPGYSSKKEFIAAQGPLPCTVNDFWRMIWEKNVHTLVMLTKCNEQGRVKCEEYWPAEMKHYNNLTVTSTSEIPLDDWTIRDFEVKNLKTTETRSVRHFHFTAWPDHGVPETTELLINFRHLVREHMDQYSRHSPTLVHCSAGVGRTGTFIAIDRLIFQIERDDVVDVYGVIHDLRMHRPLMVQTEDQYVFLNQCAMDIIRSRTGNNVDLIYQNTAALVIYENFEPLRKSKNDYHKA